MVPSVTPYDLPFPPKLGFHMPPTYANGHISLQRVIRSTYVWFYGGVFGDGGFNGAIYDSNKSKMAATAMLETFQVAISPQPVVRSTSCLVIGGVFGDGGSSGAIFDSNKFLDNFEWPYLRNASRSTYIARIARLSLR